MCEKLDAEERQKLCNIAMKTLVATKGKYFAGGDDIVETNTIRALQFVDKKGYPSPCTRMTIDEIGMSKRMYWCPSRQFKSASQQTEQAEGFYVTGSRIMQDTAFIFKQSSGNRVAMHARMTWVTLLPAALHRGRGSMVLC